jgi:hypothetical protein
MRIRCQTSFITRRRYSVMSVETEIPEQLPQETPEVAPPPQETKTSSFSRLRKEKERLEQELRQLKEKSSVAEAVKLAGVDSDAWVEGKQMPDILSSFAKQIRSDLESDLEVKLESRFKQYKQDHLYSYMQAETGAHYGKVVTDASLRKLMEKEPEMEVVLDALKDHPEKYAQVVYRKCARMAEEERLLSENKARLDMAASRPGRRYAQAVSPPVEQSFDVYNMKPGDNSAYEYIKNLKRQIKL